LQLVPLPNGYETVSIFSTLLQWLQVRPLRSLRARNKSSAQWSDFCARRCMRCRNSSKTISRGLWQCSATAKPVRMNRCNKNGWINVTDEERSGRLSTSTGKHTVTWLCS
jgi:hypothetical protein